MTDKDENIESFENKDAENTQELIEQASERLNLEMDWMRAITSEEVQYLLDHCPFLQIIDTAVRNEPPRPVHLVESISGWTIHDYGDAMSASPGRLLFGGGNFRIFFDDEEDEGGGGAIINPGKGTIYKQAIDTAMQMIDLADLYGWHAVKIIDGHPLMKRAAWIRANQLAMAIEGYEPSEQDKKVRDRLERSEEELDVLRSEMKKHGPQKR